MKNSKKIKLAMLVAFGVCSTSSFAGIISNQSFTFASEAKVKDYEGGGATSNNAANMGSFQIPAFNPQLGVLTGVKVNLSSLRTQSVQVSATSGTGSTTKVTSKGLGTSTAKVTAPGITQVFSSVSLEGECIGKRNSSCTGDVKKATVNTGFAASSMNLDAYAGAGQVRFDLSLPAMQVAQASNVFSGVESTEYWLAWAGKISVDYEYLLHAAPSFDSQSGKTVMTLDFGKVRKSGTGPYLAFDIFNLSGANRIGLDLQSVDGSGDVDKLTTDLAEFYNLQANSGSGFRARFDTTEAGLFNAQYSLHMSDVNLGAASTWQRSDLVLNLTGEVVDVPEPVSIALFGLGFAGLMASRKRRALTH